MKTVAIDATLNYSPSGTFKIGGASDITIDKYDPWEILSIQGGAIDKQSFLQILDSRGRIVKKGRPGKMPDDVAHVSVVIPIRILGVSGNKVIRFRLTDHAQQVG